MARVLSISFSAGVAAFLLLILNVPLAAMADELDDITKVFRAGRPTEALRLSDAFLALNPRDPRMRFLKGVILMDQKQPSQAQTIFEQLTQDYPELPEPYNNLAVLYAAQGDYGKARVALEMVVRANPGYALGYENLGDVNLKLAAQAYAKAQTLNGGSAGVKPKLAAISELLNPATSKSD